MDQLQQQQQPQQQEQQQQQTKPYPSRFAATTPHAVQVGDHQQHERQHSEAQIVCRREQQELLRQFHRVLDLQSINHDPILGNEKYSSV